MRGADKSGAVRFDELEAALRLALELRELPAGSELQKRHALDGLRALVGAQVGVWAYVDGVRDGTGTLRTVVDLGWSGDAERSAFRSYVDREQWVAIDPSMPPLARAATGPIGTFTREQLVDDRTWYRSEHVQRLRRRARVDSFIYTYMACAPATAAPATATVVALSMHRAWGARPFSERERRLVDIFHRACGFLHAPPRDLAPALVRGLGPRLRQTLDGLVRGRSEKQVAAALGLSPHTVHDHVKALYRHFGVDSRGALLALCLGRRD
jgi:DNA-binding CsgD family transcriptional regulator